MTFAEDVIIGEADISDCIFNVPDRFKELSKEFSALLDKSMPAGKAASSKPRKRPRKEKNEFNSIIEKLELQVLTAVENEDRDVTGAYTSDLLSDVIANSGEGQLWITMQTHQNTLAVAKLKDLAGIIIVNDREPEDETRKKAQEEGVPLLQNLGLRLRNLRKTFSIVGK